MKRAQSLYLREIEQRLAAAPPMPSLERLNEIQAAWMALDSLAAPPEIKRQVLGAMQEYPALYLNVDPLQEWCNVIWDGMPLWPEPRRVAEGLKVLREVNPCGRQVRTDVAWCGNTGRWVALKEGA